MKRILSLALAIFSLAGFSGCRIGNKVVKAKDPTAMSGYYKTEAASMTVCAFLDGQSPRCVDAGVTSIPSSIQTIMTNPVYVSANTSTNRAYIVPNTLDTNSVFELILDSSGKVTANPLVDDPQQLWVDPACLSQIRIEKEGMIHADPGQGTVGSFKTSGTVDFTVGVLTVMGTQCAATFIQMKNCYQDATQCPGATAAEQLAEQQAIRGYLDPYLSRSALTINDLPNLRALGWEVSYQ